MRGCDSKNSHGAAAHMSKPSQGCQTRYGRCRGSWRCQKYPEMCQQKFTQQGAHMSKLLDVVTTVTDRRVADALLLGCVEAPEGPRDIQGCASKNSHGTGAAAHMSKDVVAMAQLRGLRNGARFWLQGGTPGPPAPRGCSRRVAGTRKQKLWGLYLYTSLGGLRKGAMVAAVAQLYLVLCRSRSSGSFGLRVAVVEPSAKTLGFRV